MSLGSQRVYNNLEHVLVISIVRINEMVYFEFNFYQI